MLYILDSLQIVHSMRWRMLSCKTGAKSCFLMRLHPLPACLAFADSILPHHPVQTTTAAFSPGPQDTEPGVDFEKGNPLSHVLDSWIIDFRSEGANQIQDTFNLLFEQRSKNKSNSYPVIKGGGEGGALKPTKRLLSLCCVCFAFFMFFTRASASTPNISLKMKTEF